MNARGLGLIVLCGGALLLAGCAQQELELSRRELKSVKEENEALRKKVNTLEQNVKILQAELIAARAAPALEPAPVSPGAPGTAPEPKPLPAAAPKPAKPPAPAPESKPAAAGQRTSRDYTREELKNKVVTMKSDELRQFAGPPDTLLPAGASERWVYDKLPCRQGDGGVEYITAHVLLENGRVSRILFVDNIQYGP